MFKKSHNIDFETKCFSVGISPRSDFVSIAKDQTVNIFSKEEVFDESTGALNPIYAINHQNDVVQALFSNKGSKIAINDLDHVLTLYDLDNECNVIFKTDSMMLRNWKSAFSENDSLIAYGLYELNLFNLETFKRQTLNLDTNLFYSLCFIENSLLAVGTKNGSVNLYSTDYLKKTSKIEGKLLI